MKRVVPVVKVPRRTFIQAAAAFALSPSFLTVRSQTLENSRFNAADLSVARDQLLEMVNNERGRHGLARLQLDSLACVVANKHARDMLDAQFLSHWGRDGSKHYHRYSFAGGTEAIQENVSAAEKIGSMSPVVVQQTLAEMHQKMFDEVTPDDGHRRTILFPHHTHVGFGIATMAYSVRLDELYISRYAELAAIPRSAKPASQLTFEGKLLNRKLEVHGVSVYFEPLLSPPTMEWLRTPRSVDWPATVARLRRRLPPSYVYTDGDKGIIEIQDTGKFRTPITLFSKPGINTIVLWLKKKESRAAEFPATAVCIRCE